MKDHEAENRKPGNSGNKSSFGIRVVQSAFKIIRRRRLRNKHESPADKAARVTARATVWMAIFTLVLSGVGLCQWYELTQQLNAMREDQRPIIDLNERSSTEQPQVWVTPDGRAQVMWNWYFTNFGKSKAHKFHSYEYLKVGSNSYVRSFGSEQTDTRFEIPPTKTDNGTLVSGPYYTPQDFERFMKEDYALGMLIEMEYFDGYGKRYTESICVDHLVTGGHIFKDPATCFKTEATKEATKK